MRKTDKYINTDKKKRTKPYLSVEDVLKNKRYFAILKLILWSETNNKRIKANHMRYALVKDHGTINVKNDRTKNRYEQFYSSDILKDLRK